MPIIINNMAQCAGCFDTVTVGAWPGRSCQCKNLYVSPSSTRPIRKLADPDIGYFEMSVISPTFGELLGQQIYYHSYVDHAGLHLRYMAGARGCAVCNRASASFAFRRGNAWIWICSPYCAERYDANSNS